MTIEDNWPKQPKPQERRSSCVARDRVTGSNGGSTFRAGVAEDAPRARGRWTTDSKGRLRWEQDWFWDLRAIAEKE